MENERRGRARDGYESSRGDETLFEAEGGRREKKEREIRFFALCAVLMTTVIRPCAALRLANTTPQIFVGNFDISTTVESLNAAFIVFGAIVEVVLPADSTHRTLRHPSYARAKD